MANIQSAKKANRASLKKKKFNERIREKYKKARKVVLEAISNGEKEKAQKLLPDAMKKIDKAAKKNVIHKNAASRYKSRLQKAINKLS